MQHRQQLLDYAGGWALPDVFLFTGNPIRSREGRLVMGRGAAKAVRDAYPGIDRRIRTDRPVSYTRIQPHQWIGWFQVKRHWRDDADLDLIAASARMLREHALERPRINFHLNAPGIGNGRLAWEDVAPLLEELPDNVICYR